MLKWRRCLPFIQVEALRCLCLRSAGRGTKRQRWRMYGGGRGLLFWCAQGGLSLGLEQGWQSLHFWGTQGRLRVAGVFAGAAKMGNQSSLRGCESIVTGVGIFVSGGSPGLALIPRHGGNKHGGSGGAMVVWVDSNGMQSASGEVRRAERHNARMVACSE
jgi:hypothetical protein